MTEESWPPCGPRSESTTRTLNPTERNQDPPTQQPPPTPSFTANPQTNITPQNSIQPTDQHLTNRTETEDGHLIDSTYAVAKIWCPNIQHALDLLSEECFGFHQTTSSSTLAPMTWGDPPWHHPQGQQHVQRLHLAPHPTLVLNCLCDNAHLLKSTVPIFALRLKDIRLSRDQSTPCRRSSSAYNIIRPTRHWTITHSSPNETRPSSSSSTPCHIKTSPWQLFSPSSYTTATPPEEATQPNYSKTKWKLH